MEQIIKNDKKVTNLNLFMVNIDYLGELIDCIVSCHRKYDIIINFILNEDMLYTEISTYRMYLITRDVIKYQNSAKYWDDFEYLLECLNIELCINKKSKSQIINHIYDKVSK